MVTHRLIKALFLNLLVGVGMASADADLALIASAPYSATPDSQVAHVMQVSFVDGTDITVAGGAYVIRFVTQNSISLGNSPGWSCFFTTLGAAMEATCDYSGALMRGQTTGELRLIVTAMSVGTLDTNAEIDTQMIVDNNPANNTWLNQVIIGNILDLSVTKTVATPSPITVGDQIDWRIRSSISINSSLSLDDSLTISDMLPLGAVYQGFLGGNWSCVASPPVVDCLYLGVLNPGDSAPDLHILTLFDEPGVYSNSVSVSNTQGLNDMNLADNMSSATVTIVSTADIGVVKSVSSSNLVVGESFFYQLDVGNSGPSEAINVQLVDSLPAGIELLNVVSPPDWNCVTSSGVVDCTRLSAMPANVNEVIRLDVAVPSQVGSIVNSASVSSTTSDPVTSNNSSSVSTSVGVAPDQYDLSITKSASVSVVQPGAMIVYQLEVSNAGPDSATGVLVSDTLPNELTFVSMTGVSWACEQDGQLLLCDYSGVVAANSSLEPINITAELSSAASGSVRNTATVAANGGDTNTGNNSDTATTTISTSAVRDLAVQKSVINNGAPLGQSIQFDVEVMNRGSESVSSFSVEDHYPSAQLRYVGSEGMGWDACTESDGVATCSFNGTLSPGDSTHLQLDFMTIGSAGGYSNEVRIPEENDGNPSDNSSSIEFEISVAGNAFVDLQLEKVDTMDPVEANGSYAYQLTVTNLSSSLATEIVIVDDMPSGVQFDSAEGVDWTCSDNGEISCQYAATLGLNESSSVTLHVRAPSDLGSVLNRASVTATQMDSDPSNNQAEEATQINESAGADLSISIVDSVDPVLNSQPVDYTLLVANAGPNTSQATKLILMLPDAQLQSITATDWTCDNQSPLKCTHNSSIASGGQSSLLFRMLAPESDAVLTFEASVEGNDRDPNLSNNSAIETTLVQVGLSDEAIRQTLDDALSGSSNPNVRNAASPLANTCIRDNNPIKDACDAFIDSAIAGNNGAVQQAVGTLLPDQTLAQNQAINAVASAQFRNVEARMNSLKGGSNASTNGLTFNFGNQAIAFSSLSYLLNVDEDETTDSLLASPWGFFVNGSISGGDRDSVSTQQTFDFSTQGITAGVDYRFSDQFIMGLALGYSNFDSDFSDGSLLETDAYTLTLYSSWYPSDHWYLDTKLSVGNGEFNQSRQINIQLGSFTIDDTAFGSTDTDELGVSIGVGYLYNSGPWTITPKFTISYTQGDTDGFTETGAGAYNFTMTGQSIKSLESKAGLQISRVFSTRQGVVIPQIDIDYRFESKNDGAGFSASLVGAAANEQFVIIGEDPDKQFGSASFGVLWISSGGKQFYLNYRQILALDAVSQYMINLGGRFEF